MLSRIEKLKYQVQSKRYYDRLHKIIKGVQANVPEARKDMIDMEKNDPELNSYVTFLTSITFTAAHGAGLKLDDLEIMGIKMMIGILLLDLLERRK